MKRLAMCVLAAVLFLVQSCDPMERRPPLKVSRLLMGTLVEITVVAPREKALEAAHAVVEEIKRVEALSTFHKPSPLGEVNERAGRGPFKADAEILDLIGRSLEAARETDGAFDPTIGALTRLWNFSAGAPRVPAAEEIKEALRKVGWDKVKLDRAAGTIELPMPGMALDLGGIAKGYALDRAGLALKKLGVKNALVNAGGDVLVMGEKEPGLAWRVGIQDPRSPREVMGLVHAVNCVVVTSGDYERRMEVNGKTYHHILDPRTGYPTEGLQSVTVVAEEGWRADALSTGVFVLGMQKGAAVIAATNKEAALLVDADTKRVAPENAKGLFEIRR